LILNKRMRRGPYALNAALNQLAGRPALPTFTANFFAALHRPRRRRSSPSAYGTEWVDQLTPCPLLLVHGTEDEVLAPASLEPEVQARAAQPKQLYLFDGARHLLDEAADEVHGAVARLA
jgi:pimeloyl-ACP methyl ester carboxylesterase